MREKQFIEQNKEKWGEFERVLNDKYAQDPDKLSDLFVQVTDDLSYSRTFYPNRLVRAYINGLAQRIFLSVYRSKNSRASRLRHFWTEDLPRQIYDSRREFALSFFLFFLAFGIGVLSGANNPEFARIILGDGYVDMTLENIEKGDPMGVYKDMSAFAMSLGIIGNNLFVAYLTFLLGALYAIGTVSILIRNGVMVGVFQYFFIERGLFRESFLTIWMHGTLEISAIVIAGAAGLAMGRGLVFPGTFTRGRAFSESARRGFKIMLGVTPLFIVAGFIEGYLTRHTEAPDFLRALFIGLCLAFVLFYFWWYPRKKARQGFINDSTESALQADVNESIRLDRIKSSGEIFSDAVVFFRKNAGYFAGWSFLGALAFCLIALLVPERQPAQLYAYDWNVFGMLSELPTFFKNPDIPWLPLLHIPLFGMLSLAFLRRWRQSLPPVGGRPGLAGDFVKMCAGSLALVGLSSLSYNLTHLFIAVFFPFFLFWMFIMLQENTNPVNGIFRTLTLVGGQLGRMFGLILLTSLIGFLIFLIADTGLVWMALETVAMNISLPQESMNQVAAFTLTLVGIFLFYLFLGFVAVCMAVFYHTALEIREAPHLRAAAEKVGAQRRIQGLPRE